MDSVDRAAMPIEYVHRKATYVFPPASKIFAAGDRVVAEIGNRRVRDISVYKVEGSEGAGGCRYGLPVTGAGSELVKEYEVFANYFAKHPRLSLLQFEHATSRVFALCTFFKPMDFVKAGNLIAEINRAMPHIVNIFRRPLIHLRQAEIVQPVDAVKRINHNTIKHLSRHVENWKEINSKTQQIVPAKLLTCVYEDDYGIYENIVFRDTIDAIMQFLRKRIYYLTEILETFKESIQLDAVNRFNHQNYYLAIGKLYVGFYKMENSAEIQSALDNLKTIYKQIVRYMSRAVYTKNLHAKAVEGEIKRTNILTMHKDYKHIFALAQMFKRDATEGRDIGNSAQQEKSQIGYSRFCSMLTVFAANNFNFDCDEEEKIFTAGRLNADLVYKGWSMKLRNVFCRVLDFDIISMTVENAGVQRSLAIIPISYHIASDKKRQYENIVERMHRMGYVFDKYVFAEPFDAHDGQYSYGTRIAGKDLYYAVLPISVSEINSFRRIQRLILETLVLSNRNSDTCAFCGEALGSKDSVCKKCKMEVKKIVCKHCGNPFTTTCMSVKKVKSKRAQIVEEAEDAIPEFFRQEKEDNFRTIVNMKKQSFVCPCCGGENDDKKI